MLVAAAKKINQRGYTAFWLVVPRHVSGIPDNFDSRDAHLRLYALYAGYCAKPVFIALNKRLSAGIRKSSHSMRLS